MLTVAAAAIDEADANLHFTVAATPPSTQMVTVRYATSDGTAAEGSDYTAASGTLTLTVGQPAATVAVPVHEDAVDEADEQFTLTLSEPTGARLAGDQATVTATGAIIDDDLRGVTVRPTELTLNSGENGVYKVALTSEPTGPVTVTPTVGDDGDLTLVPPRLTFETDNWSTPQAFTVIVDSGRRIVRRAITHDATGADYDDVTPDQVTVTTAGEAPEPPPPTPPRSTSVTLQLEPDRVAEGAGAASVRIAAALDASPRPDATAVTVTVSGGSAEVGTDFVSVPSFTVSIPAHAQSGAATFTLAPVDDLLDEVDETVTVGGSTDASDLTVHGATLTISDDDAAPRLSIADARAVENSGESLFQVRLERASGRQITVVCMSEDGTATAPDDYEGEVGVLTLEPGQTAASIRLAVRDDRTHEPDETLKMVLSEPSNVKLEHGAATATGTIIDDDAAVTRMWLSRFGRTVAAEVLDAVAQRLDDAAVSDSRVSIGGHRLQPSGGAAEPEPERTVLADNVETDAMHFSDLLAGSSFLVASDTAVPAAGADAPRHDAGGSAAGGSWAAWGRGFATQLAGTDGEVTLSGQVIGGIAGFDYDWGWMLAGLSAAHSRFAAPGSRRSRPGNLARPALVVGTGRECRGATLVGARHRRADCRCSGPERGAPGCRAGLCNPTIRLRRRGGPARGVCARRQRRAYLPGRWQPDPGDGLELRRRRDAHRDCACPTHIPRHARCHAPMVASGGDRLFGRSTQILAEASNATTSTPPSSKGVF